jgi:hypothetical protein
MMAADTAETEYEMPPETKSPTPPVTPLSDIAGKVAAAVDAKKNGAAATTPPAETPLHPDAAPVAPGEKSGPRHKLIQVLLEDQPAFRDALVKAAADAQLSPASWAKATLAKALNVEIPAAEKRAADPIQKAVLAADKRLLELVLIRDHYGRIAESEPIIKPMHVKATATVTSYVKKLAETVGQEKADAILKATEEKVAATRK